MSNKLCENFRKLLAVEKITISELARRTGIKQPVLYKIYTGETSNPNVLSLSPVAKYFKVSISQLIGDEELFVDNPNLPPVKNQIWYNVPLLKWHDPVHWLKNKKEVELENISYTTVPVSENAYALKIKESLEILIKDTVLIIDPAIAPTHGDFVICQRKNQKEASVKQIIINDGDIYLRSLIKDFQIAPKSKEDYDLLGVVVQYRKDLQH